IKLGELQAGAVLKISLNIRLSSLLTPLLLLSTPCYIISLGHRPFNAMETPELLQVPQELTTTIERILHLWVKVASTVIMRTEHHWKILDWLLISKMEVTLIWGAEYNLSKGLYMVSWYMPFINISIVLMFIFTLQTWVVWGKQKCMALGLAVCYIAMWVVILVITGLYLWTAVFMPSLVPQLMGCIEQSPSVLMSGSYIAKTVYNAIMLVLILIPGISAYVIYYIYIFSTLSRDPKGTI
ncbi:hypothetical protein P691DRAFT_849922, partial [Macrolepiota fuliginosa MF-IS2]